MLSEYHLLIVFNLCVKALSNSSPSFTETCSINCTCKYSKVAKLDTSCKE